MPSQCSNPLLLPALAIGGASVLNGLLSSYSGSKANSANLQATRETNAVIAEQNAQQRMFEREMMTRQENYNSAAAQAQRWREAGFNPTLAMQNGSAGEVSVPGLSAPENPVTPHVDPVPSPFQGVAEGVASAASTYFQNSLLKEQTDIAHADALNALTKNQLNNYRAIAEIDMLKQQKKLTAKQADIAEQNLNYLVKTANDRVAQVGAQNNLLRAQHQQATASALLEDSQRKTEDALRFLRGQSLRAGVRLSNKQVDQLGALIGQINEETNQMILNGESVRVLNKQNVTRLEKECERLDIDAETAKKIQPYVIRDAQLKPYQPFSVLSYLLGHGSQNPNARTVGELVDDYNHRTSRW